MPLPMVHLGVAEYILEKKPEIIEKAMFYLGAISPDAVHTREINGKDDKAISHMHESDDDVIWMERTLRFINENRSSPDFSFLLGYGVHIMTDIIWHGTVYADFKRNYTQDTAPLQDQRSAYYNDTDKLDIELYNTCGWRLAVWSYLDGAKGITVGGMISGDEADAWNRRTLPWYDARVNRSYNPLRYITIDDIHRFIADAGQKIYEKIC